MRSATVTSMGFYVELHEWSPPWIERDRNSDSAPILRQYGPRHMTAYTGPCIALLEDLRDGGMGGTLTHSEHCATTWASTYDNMPSRRLARSKAGEIVPPVRSRAAPAVHKIRGR